MGSAFTPGGNTQGVIPKVMDSIFQRITSSKDAEYTVRVGFVEIHKVNTPCNILGFDKHACCCQSTVHLQHDQPLQHAKVNGMQLPVRPGATHVMVCCS